MKSNVCNVHVGCGDMRLQDERDYYSYVDTCVFIRIDSHIRTETLFIINDTQFIVHPHRKRWNSG